MDGLALRPPRLVAPGPVQFLPVAPGLPAELLQVCPADPADPERPGQLPGPLREPAVPSVARGLGEVHARGGRPRVVPGPGPRVAAEPGLARPWGDPPRLLPAHRDVTDRGGAGVEVPLPPARAGQRAPGGDRDRPDQL